MKNLAVIVGVTLFLLNSQAQDTTQRHRVGNGGVGLASAFTTIAHNFLSVWEESCSFDEETPQLVCEQIDSFKQRLDPRSDNYTRILESKSTYLVDGPRDMTNDGVSLIEVNDNYWRKSVDTTSETEAKSLLKLIMHEYFTIMGLDSSDYYKPSSDLVGSILRKGYLALKLIEVEGLPSNCSLNLKSKRGEITQDNIKNIKHKNYKLSKQDETTRYTLKTQFQCTPEKRRDNCALYFELIDNIKDTVLSDGIQSKLVKRNRKNVEHVKSILILRAYQKMPACVDFKSL